MFARTEQEYFNTFVGEFNVKTTVQKEFHKSEVFKRVGYDWGWHKDHWTIWDSDNRQIRRIEQGAPNEYFVHYVDGEVVMVRQQFTLYVSLGDVQHKLPAFTSYTMEAYW